MAIQIRCDCGEILRIPRPAPGEEWKCPSCGSTIQGWEDGQEPADAMEIPIQGSAIGLKQAGPASAGVEDPAKEDLDDEPGESEAPEELEGAGNGIPKGMLWGVFLVLLGLLGMIFLLKPGTRQETAEPGREALKAETPVPVGEDASVRIALEPSAGEGKTVFESVPPVGGGTNPREAPPAANPPHVPPPAASAVPPQPEAVSAAPFTSQEPATKQAVASDAASRPAAPAPAVPRPAAAPAKPEEKIARSKQAVAKPAGAYALNVGSFKARKNAEALRQELEQKGIEATVTEVSLPDKGTWYRVSVGRFSTPAAARRLAQELERKWQIPSFVAQLD